jgi:hypothetical protein
VANVFKPMMARGELNLIGATTLNDADLVVRLEGVAQAAQNHDGLGHRRLGHRHRLEACRTRRSTCSTRRPRA